MPGLCIDGESYCHIVYPDYSVSQLTGAKFTSNKYT